MERILQRMARRLLYFIVSFRQNEDQSCKLQTLSVACVS